MALKTTAYAESPAVEHCDKSPDIHHQNGHAPDADLDLVMEGNLHEHSITVLQALREYPWAVMWSLIISMAIVMEGYATALIGNLYAYPTYAEQFGVKKSSDSYQIPANWQSAMGSGPQGGAFVGAFLNGWIIHRFGYKPAFCIALILMASFICISFFGFTVELQAVGQIMCGVPWGMIATIGPAYASEVCPLKLRPFLTAYVNMCWTIGQFISAGVLKSFIDRSDEWAWRIPFALQWMWMPALAVAAVFMPESPWHLIRKGRHAEAEKLVHRLVSEREIPHVKALVALMIHTNKLEEEISAGTSYFDCFRGTDLRRTEIACVVFIGQVTCGAQFAYSATYFFQQAGLNPDNAYALNLGATAIGFICSVLVWFLLNRVGRRRLYVTGMSLEALWLLIIGALTFSKSPSAKWVQAGLCLVWLGTFHLSLGPVGWVIPSEVSSTRLRSKTVVLARCSYYLVILVANTIQPYMMNPTAWNWKGKSGFFWFAFAFLTAVWAFFRMPETRTRTYDELDIMFEAKLPTRQFRNYTVDTLQTHGNSEKQPREV
ncbi:alpha-glucoside transport [Fusarium pseudocircinatum]|uniref:Alpha-glucoside transport n=1 Tax=Fusarium pseudocircinatum TaxID=56676 RepID=A0A8H5L1B2_9HYPO|nr:alpha-glucoside transport [Fusarium pseudocircinatum]